MGVVLEHGKTKNRVFEKSCQVESFKKRLDKKDKAKIIDKIAFLSENPEVGKPLRYVLHGYLRVKVGKYRIIYRIKEKEKIVFIVAIGHRKTVYRR